MSKKCFFICPIGEDNSPERKRSDQIMEHILYPMFEKNDCEVVRSDKIASLNKINDDIVFHLENDELAIADLTGHNPNVFYEVGYRHAKRLPVIHIAENGTTLPFDISSHRILFYNLTNLDDVDNFKKNLSNMIDVAQNEGISNISKAMKEPAVDSLYITLLVEIVEKYNANNGRGVHYNDGEINKNNMEILTSLKYIEVNKYINGSVNIKPTGEGLKYLIDNHLISG